MNYAEDTLFMLEICNIEKNKFETWLFTIQNLKIGTAYLVHYLICKKKNIVNLKYSYPLLTEKLELSEQAKKVAKHINTEIDERELKNWFVENLIISRNYVTDYVVNYLEKK